jgi:pteridine reductase
MTGTTPLALAGKVALVTGGGVRIGRALALALASAGARVALHFGRSAAEAAATVEAIGELGSEAAAFPADLRDLSRVEGLIAAAAERFGRIDLLVNSAAVFAPGGVPDTTEPLWDEHFAVNLKAPFFLSRAFARHVGTERSGQIVNIADWRGAHPDPGYLAYSLTKAGLIAMTRTLGLALAPNIRVNAIAPGAILPPPGRDKSYLEGLGKRLPLQRHGTPDEVAGALIYLATAEFVTGQVIFVDGGEHLGGSIVENTEKRSE